MSDLSSSIAIVDNLIAKMEKLIAEDSQFAGEGADVDTPPATAVSGEKQKKARNVSAVVATAVSTSATQFLSCDLRVGKVVRVAHHPEADTLFHLTIDVGGGETRSVCAGLREYLSDVEMEGRLVVLVCNLKPRKLRGIDSEAMCLAGSVVDIGGKKETVVPIAPPLDASPGTFVVVDGITGDRSVIERKFVNAKTWEKVSSRFCVRDGVACYDGMPMCTASGSKIECALPDGATIR